MQKILLQTTIPSIDDDWNVTRFSMLAEYLSGLRGPGGLRLYEVVARDKASADGDDPVLSKIDVSDFDQLWLFAVDLGGGISENECAAIGRFRARDGGLLTTRDHADLGSSLCSLGGVGRAHHFHSKNQNPDESRRVDDDNVTTSISWPNCHSGNNGDLQTIEPVAPPHRVLHAKDRLIHRFPAHPHEGDVSAPPDDPTARVIARGTSVVTGRPFNIAVVFEPTDGNGHALAESTFHHFADYNWDVSKGCPSFVGETPGNQIASDPHALDDIKTYVANVAAWLS